MFLLFPTIFSYCRRETQLRVRVLAVLFSVRQVTEFHWVLVSFSTKWKWNNHLPCSFITTKSKCMRKVLLLGMAFQKVYSNNPLDNIVPLIIYQIFNSKFPYNCWIFLLSYSTASWNFLLDEFSACLLTFVLFHDLSWDLLCLP
jgi:hypothetical protein